MKKRCLALFLIVCTFGSVFCFFGCTQSKKSTCRYEIQAEFVPEHNVLRATQKMVYENATESVLERIEYNLYGNAYRESVSVSPVPNSAWEKGYYNGESHGAMEITSVSGGKSWEIVGEDKSVLCVWLETPLFSGDSVTIDVAYTLSLATANTPTGVSECAVNLGHFYPSVCAYTDGYYRCEYSAIGDPFVAECADFEVLLTLPKNYVVASSGRLIEEHVLERKKACLYRVERARDFAFVLSENFCVDQLSFDGVEIVYYHFGTADDGVLQTAQSALATYASAFGKYPYPTYSVVQTGLYRNGAEFTALSMIGQKGGEQGTDYTHTVAHQTAHQWWYGVVGNNQIESGWLDEGLAEYATVLYFERTGGKARKEMVDACQKNYRTYLLTHGATGEKVNEVMARPITDFETTTAYETVCIDKAVLMYDLLRESVGDKRFFKALQTYYKGNQFTIATPACLVGAFEKTGVDAHGFFEGFLQGTAVFYGR